MDYYVYKDDQNIGPLTESEVGNGIRSGRFLSNDLACRVGETAWKDLSFLFPLETSPPVALAPQIVYQPPPMYQQQAPVPHQPQIVYQQPPTSFSNNSDVGKVMMYESNKKSTGIAYLLWFFFGMFGAHRFYIGETGTGVAILLITVFSFFLMFVAIGFFTIFISSIWVFIDLFLIPSMVQKQNNLLAARLNIYS